jgi:hypothetical protein
MARISFKMHTEGLTPELLGVPCSLAERKLAVEVLKDTDPFVPASVEKSIAGRARVEGNKIIYPGPYARYLYYGKVMVNAETGKGPMKITNKYGETVIRWPKGAKLVASEKDLSFDRSTHPMAQSHWMEASKAKNMEHWKKFLAKAVENGLHK